jgi:hypothetical protein
MESVAAVFTSRYDAEHGSVRLLALGIPKDRINILTPHATEKELAAVPIDDAEPLGVGKAMGAAVGGAVGLAGGIGLGGAVTSLIVPGIGPVLAIGFAGAAVLAVLGGAAGGAIEKSTAVGLPGDELFVYEDALRQGRTVVIAQVENGSQAEAARGALENAGAESIDRAREMWWIGLRDAEKETYESSGGTFEDDERYFRCGFEAALHSENRDKSYDKCRARLGDREARLHEREPFQRGYDRGRAYSEIMKQRHR